MGSYPDEDVTFLLKDLSDISMEKSTTEREQAIQQGTHYSEMLPIEYKPTDEYLSLFYRSLEDTKHKVAVAVGIVAEQIIAERGFNIALVSLARAGTPIGVLIKRYISYKYNRELPHYSISIIRDRGIDVQALDYIRTTHPEHEITFIDGWTGKGAITKELTKSVSRYNETNGTTLSSKLAVLADPGDCSELYGTREDFLIPSACLNSTVSGLVSRTILNSKWINEGDFHGGKYYSELLSEDVSNLYVDTICTQFPLIESAVDKGLSDVMKESQKPQWKGLTSIENIQRDYNMDNTNFIKPGVGETTRVLLRRVPWKILVHPDAEMNLEHILVLARERGVPIEEYTDMSYSCCGLIQPLEKKT
ncbi:cysteine protease StiP family protein [Alkalihalobacillus macyae]|nr:cysteine protease StiP family protein [Alkalihalobacillus macyae]MDP4552191.1 cysteine protease StiP family protein [Alkalihalobacillus macyae]